MRASWAWHREMALSLSLSLNHSLCFSPPLSHRREQRSLTSQPSHNDRDLFDTDLQPQFQYIDSSRSTDCPLTKPLAAASQYLEPPMHCSSVVLFCHYKLDTIILCSRLDKCLPLCTVQQLKQFKLQSTFRYRTAPAVTSCER